MRVILSAALKEATAGIGDGSTKGVEKDASRTATRVKAILGEAFGHARGLVSKFNQSVAQGTALLLLATKAGVALAAISSLTTGIVGLVGVLGQAAGAAGLLPAALLAVKAVSATLQVGLLGVGDTVKALASGDMAAFQESLKKLSPEARKVIGSLAQFKGQIDLLKSSTQDNLFRGLEKPLDALVAQTLPQVRALMNGIAISFNGAAKESIGFLNSAQAQSGIATLFGNIRQAVAGLAPAFKPALSAFLDISSVGSNFLPQLTAGITRAATSFGEFIRGAAASGALQAFFQRALDTLHQLGQVLVQIGGTFAGVFKAADAAGGGFLNSLLTITTAFNHFVSSSEGQTALTSFFASMREIIAAVIPVVLSVANVVATSLVPIFSDLAKTVLPVLNTVVQAFGAALVQARPGITALAQGLATMLEVFGPTITLVVQLAGILGGVLGKVLQALAPALAKVANALVNGLVEIMPKLEPVILAVADAVVQLINAALPLVPLFLQLIVAALPLLPPLIQLVSAILPPLIGLVQALMPVFQSLIQILVALLPPITSVVTTILNILIPPIKLIAEVVAQVAGIVADVFSAMSSTVTTILNVLGGIISGIWGGIVAVFTGAVSAIGSAVRGAFDGIKSAISNVMGSIGSTIKSGLDSVVGFFRDLPGRIGSFFATLASDAFNAGKNIIQGIINGLGNIAGAIVDKLKQIVSAAWNAVLNFFGIGSPSKLADETFQWVGKGAIRGLEKIAPEVIAAASDMARSAMAAMADPLASGLGLGPISGGDGAALAAGGVAPGGFQQINIMQPGVDGHQFATETAKLGAQRLATGGNTLPVSGASVQSGMRPPGTLTGVSL